MNRSFPLLALVAALVACGDERPQTKPFTAPECRDTELGCPRPIFAVANLRDGLAYYRDKLGFKIDWQYGEPADFASVSRSETTIFIAQTQGAGRSALWVFAKHVDKLHAELKRRGASIEMPPTDMPWGSREMHVRDHDGNLIRFGGPIQ